MSENQAVSGRGYRLTPKTCPTRAGRLRSATPRAMSSSSRPKNGRFSRPSPRVVLLLMAGSGSLQGVANGRVQRTACTRVATE